MILVICTSTPAWSAIFSSFTVSNLLLGVFLVSLSFLYIAFPSVQPSYRIHPSAIPLSLAEEDDDIKDNFSINFLIKR